MPTGHTPVTHDVPYVPFTGFWAAGYGILGGRSGDGVASTVDVGERVTVTVGVGLVGGLVPGLVRGAELVGGGVRSLSPPPLISNAAADTPAPAIAATSAAAISALRADSGNGNGRAGEGIRGGAVTGCRSGTSRRVGAGPGGAGGVRPVSRNARSIRSA